jgi:hypothetical protein
MKQKKARINISDELTLRNNQSKRDFIIVNIGRTYTFKACRDCRIPKAWRLARLDDEQPNKTATYNRMPYPLAEGCTLLSDWENSILC